MGILYILLLSIPFFYVLGIVYVISFLFPKKEKRAEETYGKEPGSITYLRTAIKELTIATKISPNKTVQMQLGEYKKQLKELISRTESANEEGSLQLSSGASVGFTWSHWYSNNSINLLLYIGAFLVVAAASIFVGFQWETIPGIVKAILLTMLTVGFFACGMWFYTIPKIKTAGYTFIGIGALLIPVCGSAWHTFVFKALGAQPGPVWLITSLVALTVYIFLAANYKSVFYTYVSSASTLSFSLSIVSTLHLANDFYILASITTSFILLLTCFLIQKEDAAWKLLVQVPLEISSNIMLPASLLFGLYRAVTENKLLTMEVVLSVFIAAAFYLLSYRLSRRTWKIAFAAILFPLGIVLFFGWQNLEKTLLFYVLDFCALLYIYQAYFFQNKKYEEETNVTITLGAVISTLVFISSILSASSPEHPVILSFILVIIGALIAYVKKNISFTWFSAIFLAATTYLFHTNILNLASHQYLSLEFLGIALLYYGITVYLRDKPECLQTFSVSSGLFFSLSFFISLSFPEYRLGITLIISFVLLLSSYLFSSSRLIYPTCIFMYISLYNTLQVLHINQSLYPLFFVGFSVALYVVGLSLGKSKEFRVSALTVTFCILVFYALYSTFGYYDRELEKYALLSSYITVILYGFDNAIYKTPNFGYVTSALGITTYIWQVYYLGSREALIYSLPLGVYFFILAYTRRTRNDTYTMQILDLTALFITLVPPTLLSLGDNGVKYSIILGILGVALLTAGISFSYRLYKYGGVFGIIFAIVPQTYSYILALPRWVIVGGAGIIFLSAAILLLLKRKED